MSQPEWLTVSEEVRTALDGGQPVVALESTLIAHGLPWPDNLRTAQASEAAVRAEGAIPATIAVWQGKSTVGLSPVQIEELAQTKGVLKASRRDLARAVAEQRTAATTVSATMHLAHTAGIGVFATGGIGGAHRDGDPFDISADLYELARTPVLVVCAGAKSILDLPRTLEILETLGVPVVGFGTDRFPAFYVRTSNLPTSARVATSKEAAQFFAIHRQLTGGGLVLAQPIAEEFAIGEQEFEAVREQCQREATEKQISGPAVTPYLLKRLAEVTQGKTLIANRELIVANARLAAQVARELAG
jgi:pseudouridine-5'-phosphate glycosidase